MKKFFKKFSGYCFYMNANIEGDFQIWISVPLIFVFKNHTIGYYVAIWIALWIYFTSFNCLAAQFIREFIQFIMMVEQMSCSWQNALTAFAGTLLVYYFFVWASCRWKKQYYTFNNSLLQALGKGHVLFLKKIFKFFSRFSVCSLYNSESGPMILQFLDSSNHQIA